MHGWILVGTHLGAAIAGGILYRLFGAMAIKQLKADLAAAQAEVTRLRNQAAGYISGSQAQKPAPITK